jgi:hypothetical protein
LTLSPLLGERTKTEETFGKCYKLKKISVLFNISFYYFNFKAGGEGLADARRRGKGLLWARIFHTKSQSKGSKL